MQDLILFESNKNKVNINLENTSKIFNVGGPAQMITHNSISTGCERYWRPFFKMVSCINRSCYHDKIFTVYPLLHLLLSTGIHLLERLKGPWQENQRAVIVKKIRTGWGKTENKKFKKQGIWELQ